MSAAKRVTAAVLSAAADAAGDATDLDVVAGVLLAAATVVGCVVDSGMVDRARRTAHLPTLEGALSRAIVAVSELKGRKREADEVPS